MEVELAHLLLFKCMMILVVKGTLSFYTGVGGGFRANLEGIPMQPPSWAFNVPPQERKNREAVSGVWPYPPGATAPGLAHLTTAFGRWLLAGPRAWPSWFGVQVCQVCGPLLHLLLVCLGRNDEYIFSLFFWPNFGIYSCLYLQNRFLTKTFGNG